MAKLIGHPVMGVKAILELDHRELKALDGLTGYGFKPFIETFQKHMGKSYIEGYEPDLERFFIGVRESLSLILEQFREDKSAYQILKQRVTDVARGNSAITPDQLLTIIKEMP